MKKIILFLALLIGKYSYAQVAKVTLEGIVFQYQEKGNNSFLRDVNIIAPGSGSIVTKENGYYSFEFDNSVHKTTITVLKKGFEVINQEDLKYVDLKKNKIQNIYCDWEGNTEKRRRELLDESLRQSKKLRDNYFRVLENGGEAANKLIRTLEKSSGRTLSTIDAAKVFVFDKFGADVASIEQIAATVIRLNLDHSNQIVEKIKKISKEGNITEALQLLDFAKAIKEVRFNNDLLKTTKAKNLAQKEIFVSAIPLLISHGEYEKADSAYYISVLADSADLDLDYNYALFLRSQNNIVHASEIFHQLLQTYKGESTYRKAIVELNYAELLAIQNDVKKAQSHFNVCLEFYTNTESGNKEKYLVETARVHAGFAKLFEFQHNEKESNKELSIALLILNRYLLANGLSEGNIFKGLSIAMASNNVEKQIQIMKELTHLFSDFVPSDNHSKNLYIAFIAALERQIGISLEKLGDRVEAEINYKSALEKFRQLEEKNPSAYQNEVALTLGNYGMFMETNNPSRAKLFYSEILSIYRTLSKNQPSIYQPLLAAVLERLAEMMKRMRNLKEAKYYILEQTSIYKLLADKNQDEYSIQYCASLDQLSKILIDLKQRDSALSIARHAYGKILEIRKSSKKENNDLALSTIHNLAVLYDIFGIADTFHILNQKTLEFAKTIDFLQLSFETQEKLLYWCYSTGSNNIDKNNLIKAAEELVQAASYANILYNPSDSDFKFNRYIYSDMLDVFEKLNAKDSLRKYCNEFANIVGSYLGAGRPIINYVQSFEISSELANYFLDLCIKDSATKYYRIAASFTDSTAFEISTANDKRTREKLIFVYGNASWYAIKGGKFKDGEIFALKAFTVDTSAQWVNINLAHSMLFQDRIEDARQLYMTYLSKPKRSENSISNVEALNNDFEELKCTGVLSAQRKNMLEKMKEEFKKAGYPIK